MTQTQTQTGQATNWAEQFQPVVDAAAAEHGRAIEIRPQQEMLGDAVIATLANKTQLVAECPTGTGKSLGYLIPLIHQVKTSGTRAVVSTETTTLQDQLVDKDLPYLKTVYGPFTFRALKGRSWYLCLNRAQIMLRGNASLGPLISELDAASLAAMRDGEQRDAERVLGHAIPPDLWKSVVGESIYCTENKCRPDRCWSTRARALALQAQIVVTNHALLRTDADMRAGGTGGGLLGDVDMLVVDEAHTLEKVLVDGWTTEVTPYDLDSILLPRILRGISKAANVIPTESLVALADECDRTIHKTVKAIQNINSLRLGPNAPSPAKWKRETFLLSEIYLSGHQSQPMLDALTEYEIDGPKRFSFLSTSFKTLETSLRDVLKTMQDNGVGGKRDVSAAVTAAKTLGDMCGLIEESLGTRDGIVTRFGVPYAIMAQGRTRGRGPKIELGLALQAVPLDVSKRAGDGIFGEVDSSVLVSATLRDPATGDFRFTVESLGVRNAETLVVPSPFDFATQQLIYITPADRSAEDVPGAKFSLDELVDVINASQGRTLALFTARSELEHAAEQLRRRAAAGSFDWPLLVQEDGVTKQKLVERFIGEHHSVLLATKSFFTGVDFPGEACSTVVLCKYPLPQYNALCKAQITHWRGRGFPKWYEREGLLTFSQAVGRLIRAGSDRGVVAILDQRAADTTEGVHSAVATGIRVLCPGSQVTQDITQIHRFFDGIKV